MKNKAEGKDKFFIMYEIELVGRDGTVQRCPMEVTVEKGRTVVRFAKEKITPDVCQVRVLPDLLNAEAGEDGYYIIPELSPGDMLCRMKPRADDEYVCHAAYHMPIMGAKRGDRARLLVLTGMTYDYDMVTGVKDGHYYSYPRLNPDDRPIYEDIAVAIYELSGADANYSGMARCYRRHQLQYSGVRPLSARARERKELRYALSAPEIRLRLAWKPVPTPVREQTPETEPPMHVAMDFKRVEELIAELKRQGVARAELCLVGWNMRGHDGRWPQIFPVEPALGGEAGLRHLIQTAQDAGYQIVCHTNSSDAYSVADCWDENLMIRKKDGTIAKNGDSWSGGDMYHVCPKTAWESFAQKDLPQVAALGFRGVHYIDVISVVPPRTCYDPRHPVTTRECVGYWNRIMHLAKEQFGGIASEGGYDFAAPELDFALYASFDKAGALTGLCDEVVPLWQLVYHGLIACNPSTGTMNVPLKSPETRLKFYEYGGRPALYFYSRFVTETKGRGNWMGQTDFLCDNQQQLEESVAKIRRLTEDYDAIADLQYCYLHSHELLAEGVSRMVYENGVEMVCNYTDAPYEYRGKTVAPKDYGVYR